MRSRLLTIVAVLALAGTASAQDNVYFGTLHAHTSYSDGSGKPAEAYTTARANGLQFLMLSEHNHADAERGAKERADGVMIATSPQLYAGSGPDTLKTAAGKATKDGTFVALWGQEFSTISKGNHVNVFGAPKVIDVPSGEFKTLVGWLDANHDDAGLPPLVQFNHPDWEPHEDNNYGRDDWGHDDAAWVAAMGQKTGLIEVLNGTATKPGVNLKTTAHETEYFEYLNLGFRLGPTAGHDNHYKNWGTSTQARTGVVAKSLTRADLMSALRARHTFASEDDNLRVIFRGNGGLMGDVVAAPAQDEELALTVEIVDPDEPNARYHVEVFRDRPGGPTERKPIQSYDFTGDTHGPKPLDGVFFQTPGDYIFLKVTQRSVSADDEIDRDRLWTAPIWFDKPGLIGPAPVAPATLKVVALIPDPAGSDLFNETATVKNISTVPMTLAGWQLRDESGNVWALDPALIVQPDEAVALKRNRAALSMNNGGDTIELLAPDGRVVQTIAYNAVGVDEVVKVP